MDKVLPFFRGVTHRKQRSSLTISEPGPRRWDLVKKGSVGGPLQSFALLEISDLSISLKGTFIDIICDCGKNFPV